ncbi:ABC transporter ATP-binding protein [Oceanospirillum linum]|nr:ABC transporter ATP-binding protein [Oceanospirillum linum]
MNAPASERREKNANTEMKSVIRTEQLARTVTDADGQALHILQGIDCQIYAGESVAILGSSGAGKSTLLGLLAGLDQSTDGEIWLNDQPLSGLNEEGRARMRQQVGFVFQSFQLLEHLTALENVMLPLELAGEKNYQAIAQKWLERVGLGQRIKHYPRQLSGGEQQRVAIARAFAGDPLVLFADEPTGNLDSVTGQSIIDLLFTLNKENQTTLILVTHDANLARHCQRRLTLQDGLLHEEQAVAVTGEA